MKKLLTGLVCIFVLLISLNLASAKLIDYKEHITLTKYDNDNRAVMTRTIYANYDNDDRHSTYNYRHGYSYRTSEDYWERHHDEDVYFYDDDSQRKRRKSGCGKSGCRDYKDYINDDYNDYDYYNDRDYYTDYAPYLKKVKSRKCYHHPPKGKLFYIKC